MFQKAHTKWVGMRGGMKKWLDSWKDGGREMRMPLGESLKVHSELTAHSWLKRLGNKAEIH